MVNLFSGTFRYISDTLHYLIQGAKLRARCTNPWDACNEVALSCPATKIIKGLRKIAPVQNLFSKAEANILFQITET